MTDRRGTVKGDAAFRTISEVAQETGVAPHILRYWETRFPQLRPLQRAGNRRYYRPADVALVRRIDTLLNSQGYTVKGVQKLLAEDMPAPAAEPHPIPEARPETATAREAAEPAIAAPALAAPSAAAPSPTLLEELRAIRDAMAEALTADR